MDVSFKDGILPIMTVGAPGVHGAGVTGTHGTGVRTPAAAEVAEATAGLARLWHIPKGIIFTIGIWSMMLAAGMFATNVWLVGNTFSVDGATPKLHCNIAPEHT